MVGCQSSLLSIIVVAANNNVGAYDDDETSVESERESVKLIGLIRANIDIIADGNSMKLVDTNLATLMDEARNVPTSSREFS